MEERVDEIQLPSRMSCEPETSQMRMGAQLNTWSIFERNDLLVGGWWKVFECTFDIQDILKL